MTIFRDYTGSAMLNNALQTIEALAGQRISSVDADSLLKLFNDPYQDGLHTLTGLNKRLKSYTMLFSKNGPLFNDKEFGEAIYKQLITSILSNAENEGPYTCELSGLRFKTTFEIFYEQTLRKVGFPASKIGGKDKTVNRCWFPLLGGLGSDAQALPQAKYAITVHPACLAIMQFLPLSAVLYKGGILLIDASNEDLSKRLIADHVSLIKSKITAGSANSPVDNIKDFTKGHYLLRALAILADKERDDAITAFNLWCFTNSGTGASCEIDRIPNQLIHDLRSLYKNPSLRPTLETILKNSKLQSDFLESLEGHLDFYGLYPNKNSEGVSIRFYEAYQQLIGNGERLGYAKYIAYLLGKEEWNKNQHKFLSKTDAPTSDYALYKSMVYEALVGAASRKEWHWAHHISILNSPDRIPIDSTISRMYRMVHFYYSTLSVEDDVATPIIPNVSTQAVGQAANLFFQVIGEDKRNYSSRWVGSRYQEVNPLPLLIREGSRFYDLDIICALLFDSENRQTAYGLRDVVRIYLNYHSNEPLPRLDTQTTNLLPAPSIEQTAYLNKLRDFANEYIMYYRDGRSKGKMDEEKFRQHVLIPMRHDSFQVVQWLDTVSESMAKTINNLTGQSFAPSLSAEEILYDYTGRYNHSFTRFVLEYLLNQFYHQLTLIPTTV
ncbi:hypothetical protein [Spirosoma utsteinense]|uniref:Uncharacterized protein n=1 Tax=Spirosoma utsteinense TaxID=2585773 RepID=A0ABR6W8L7_9BACT|nr:hypothetical protein [Spirosoma utsteinense]MBC3787235.1 hypothetical protein [Spirosoma utsteinense]MBC3792921.1 hypothetical protein [Spirosoma utsteinense]